MENSVFPNPGVAEILNERYVEARLHNDGVTNVDYIVALQEQLIGSVANPIYVLLEPSSGTRLARLQGKRSLTRFTRFLRDGLERSGEQVAAK
jgi:hypothetical protein